MFRIEIKYNTTNLYGIMELLEPLETLEASEREAIEKTYTEPAGLGSVVDTFKRLVKLIHLLHFICISTYVDNNDKIRLMILLAIVECEKE